MPNLSRFSLAVAVIAVVFAAHAVADRPNVIVIMSDDQGGGDYGFVGNEVIRTPQLDAMHARSGYLSNFYVSPVCAPTRASLMTGRYNYRTRCVDTYVGRAMMDTDEITMAELLRDAGYRTGIYGKWHMGDNYPLRAMDQGFQDSLVHRGGGIGQPSDPIGAEGKYTDPTLFKNGEEVQMKGYCTDIYFDAAMDFIGESVKQDQSFFTYIATNAPHGPFDDVPPELYEEYREVDFTPILVNKIALKRRDQEFDKLARIAAMITNIDQNVGRLFQKLDDLDISENTIVIYLNDNGPNSNRFVGDMRGMKTHVDDGGIRSPLLFHWPAKVAADRTSAEFCAHIDILPTILDACDVDVPADHLIDGRSFLPLLTEVDPPWPTRQVAFQSHRGDVPQLYNHFAFHEDHWKLVHPSGFGKEQIDGPPRFQLYDLSQDPRQENDLADSKPELTQRLVKAYEAWFADVSSTRPENYAPPRIVIGTDHEPESVLTRQDWRHAKGKPWAAGSNGFWLLQNPKAGDYTIEVILAAGDHPAGRATVKAGGTSATIPIAADQQRGHTTTIQLGEGELKLQVDVDFGGQTQGPHQVILTRN
ncbi:Arylsulfatase precursor [Rubripirellula lacrimiformis]|uniref:Arylsulfatase n=1 Tax=Rubripirellula lacrimiformis TaxID=1930273 RepID=A0A517NCZ1_9BACT|nr:sulfatase-like hydrolase/transferase [Rubripirellula lacrimiformis]QDT05004.1 Arylsulfatase precursor [Rubripirellula lacrimiformis]